MEISAVILTFFLLNHYLILPKYISILIKLLGSTVQYIVCVCVCVCARSKHYQPWLWTTDTKSHTAICWKTSAFNSFNKML